MKSNYDKHCHDHTRYAVGEIVIMTRIPISTGESTKLQDHYREPLVIAKILSHNTYRVVQLTEDHTRQFATTARVSQLKSWRFYQNEPMKMTQEFKPEEEDFMEPDNPSRKGRAYFRSLKQGSQLRFRKSQHFEKLVILLYICSFFFQWDIM